MSNMQIFAYISSKKWGKDNHASITLDFLCLTTGNQSVAENTGVPRHGDRGKVLAVGERATVYCLDTRRQDYGKK